MLTQDQLNQLQPLTQHSRFGNLLIKSIEGWKISNPKDGNYGLELKTNFNTLETILVPDQFDNCTCLFGAAMIGSIVEKPTFDNPDDPFERTVKKLGFSDNVRHSLVIGFDNLSISDCDFIIDQEAYDFAQQVRKIVLK